MKKRKQIVHERKKRAAANLAEVRNKNIVDNNLLRNSRNQNKLINLTGKNQKSSPCGITTFSE